MALVIQIDEGQMCRNCGCTNEDCECCHDSHGEICHWAEPDLCSTCASSDPCDALSAEGGPDGALLYVLQVDGEAVFVKSWAAAPNIETVTELARQLLRGTEPIQQN